MFDEGKFTSSMIYVFNKHVRWCSVLCTVCIEFLNGIHIVLPSFYSFIDEKFIFLFEKKKTKTNKYSFQLIVFECISFVNCKEISINNSIRTLILYIRYAVQNYASVLYGSIDDLCSCNLHIFRSVWLSFIIIIIIDTPNECQMLWLYFAHSE